MTVGHLFRITMQDRCCTRLNHSFTLVEMLIAICIITILAGISYGSLSQMSLQMNEVIATSEARQLIASTIQEARRNQLPLVVKFKTGTASNGSASGDYTITGSQQSMVGFWNFGDNLQSSTKGINKIDIISGTPVVTNGVLGKAVHFNGSNPLRTASSYLLNCNSDFYFECHVRAGGLGNFSAATPPTVFNGGNGKMVLRFENNSGRNYLTATGITGAGPNSAPFPEDGTWHKVGLSKIQDLGVYLYQDDLLIAQTRVDSTPDNTPHDLEFGNNLNGDIDDVCFFRLGAGQVMSMNNGGMYFGFEAEDSNLNNKMYTMLISSSGVVNGIYREGSTQPIFKNYSYVHMQMGRTCMVNLAGTSLSTSNTSGASSIKFLNHVIKKMDPRFPQKGFAWVNGSTPAASEIIQYEIYDSAGQNKIKTLLDNQLGTDGNGSLGNNNLILYYVDPITILRMGNVL